VGYVSVALIYLLMFYFIFPLPFFEFLSPSSVWQQRNQGRSPGNNLIYFNFEKENPAKMAEK